MQQTLPGQIEITDRGQFDPDKERGPIAWMAKNGVAANMLMLILIVGGLVTLATGIKQEVFPEVSMDLITVSVIYLGAAPEEVEEAVCVRVEEAIQGLEGIEEIRRFNRQRFEMEQLTAIVLVDGERQISVGYKDLTEDDVADHFGRQPGSSVDEFFDHLRREILGPGVAQAALLGAADGRAARAFRTGTGGRGPPPTAPRPRLGSHAIWRGCTAAPQGVTTAGP